MKTKPYQIVGISLLPCLNLFAFMFVLQATPVAAMDVDVSAYGAVPDDGLSDHAAFASAIESVVAGGGGTVSIAPGTYDFDVRRAVDLEDEAVALVGCGKGVTVLRCRNATGIWWFSNSENSNELSIYDLTFTAGASGNAGTAIQINNPSLSSNTGLCSLHMERVGFEPEILGTDYFYRHIFTTYLVNATFIDVFATTFGMRASSESGFRINYGDGAYFENCYSKGNDIGWDISNCKGNIIFNRCNPVDNNVGMKVTALSAEDCTVAALGVHVNTFETNLEIYRADQVVIENAASYTSATNAFTDFYIKDCTNVDIVGCEFHQPYTSIRNMVHLDGTTSDVLLKYNIFNGRPASSSQTVNDVLIEAGVSNVTQTDNLSTPTHQW